MSEIENFRAYSTREYFFFCFLNTPKAPSFSRVKKQSPPPLGRWGEKWENFLKRFSFLFVRLRVPDEELHSIALKEILGRVDNVVVVVNPHKAVAILEHTLRIIQ